MAETNEEFLRRIFHPARIHQIDLFPRERERLEALAKRGAAIPDEAEWPQGAKFHFGDLVQRCDLPSGKPPSYRFPGVVIGWYVVRQQIGYCVSGQTEPGNVLIFPEYMLELRT